MYISQEIKDGTKKKNVLLLAMSTISLPRGTNVLSKNECVFDGTIKGEEFQYSDSYYGSMEPVPMLLESFLYNKNGERLEEIIVLGTTETSEIKEVMFPEENKLKEISADDLFKENINEFCIRNGIENPDYKIFTYNKDDNDSVKNNINDIVEYIRDVKKNIGESGITFWMDDHGGFRAVQSILQSVVSILEIEDIVPEEMFSGQYNGNTQKFEIKSSKHTYDMYEFVSGMRAFFDYGRSRQLEKFFRDAEGCDKELINYVKKISDYMSLCDVKKLEMEFKALGEFLKNNPVNKFDKYLQIFIPNIEKDYGDLLNGKKNILERINWCLGKGFIQQAMAFLESWVPELIIQKSLLGYDSNSFRDMYVIYDSRNNTVRDSIGNDRKISLGDAIERARQYKNKYNFFVDNIVRSWSQSRGVSSECVIEWTDRRNRHRKYHINLDERIAPGKRDEIYSWLGMHKDLKEERNIIMHASGRKHLYYEELEEKIKKYIDLVESLMS